MPKKVWLAGALAWTIAVLVLCLVSFNDLPSVEISDADKYVHSIFHFVFTVLWFQYFRPDDRAVFLKRLLLVVLFSLTFGIFIEVAQGIFTQTRQADAKDVLANFSGSVIAAIVLLLTRNVVAQKS